MITDESTPLTREWAEHVAELRERGPIFWDEATGEWIATSYEACLQVLRNDAVLTRDDRFRPGGDGFWAGRSLTLFSGAEHRRLHALHMSLTGSDFAESIRRPTVRPAAEWLVKQMVSAGKANIASDYADRLPLLVGCRNIGIDTEDEELMTRLSRMQEARHAWKLAIFSREGTPVDSPTAVAGREATEGLTAMFLPAIRARREAPNGDLLSRAWEQGPKAFQDWSESDMVSLCWGNYDLGEVKNFLRNALYLVMVDQQLQAKLRSEPNLIAGFIEEALRYFGPSWDAGKFALEDFEICGARIKKGQTVTVVYAAADRDPEQFDCPHAFSPDRSDEVGHLAFGHGARYCVGRYMARVVAQEATRALLAATQQVRLDPDAAAPAWVGDASKTITPLHAVFY